MLYASHQACSLIVVVDIDVICQHTRCRDDQSGIFVHRVEVIDCHDLIFYFSHSNGNRGNLAVDRAIICRKGKAVLSDKVKSGSVGGNVAN